MSSVDLTASARIRDAALQLFGRQGFPATTVRQIAAAAGVSPALVLHHYGSKDGLRDACDDRVIEALSSEKAQFLVGPMPKFDEYTRAHPEFTGIVEYLVASLREGGPMADRVYDRLVALTDDLMGAARDAGMVHGTDDDPAVHAVLVAMSCGLMLLGPQVARRLGGEALTDAAVVNRYGRAAVEIFSGGLFTPAYADALRAATTGPTAEPSPTEGNPA